MQWREMHALAQFANNIRRYELVFRKAWAAVHDPVGDCGRFDVALFGKRLPHLIECFDLRSKALVLGLKHAALAVFQLELAD